MEESYMHAHTIVHTQTGTNKRATRAYDMFRILKLVRKNKDI